MFSIQKLHCSFNVLPQFVNENTGNIFIQFVFLGFCFAFSGFIFDLILSFLASSIISYFAKSKIAMLLQQKLVVLFW